MAPVSIDTNWALQCDGFLGGVHMLCVHPRPARRGEMEAESLNQANCTYEV